MAQLLGQLGVFLTPVDLQVRVGGALAGLRVARLACGDMHSAALTADGDVYAWGRGGDGQLGLGWPGAGLSLSGNPNPNARNGSCSRMYL